VVFSLLLYGHFLSLWFFFSLSLGFAMLFWGDAVVFQLSNKMTSVYIHFMPCLVTQTLRWYTTSAPPMSMTSIHLSSINGWLFAQTYLVALGLYIVWQVLYCIITDGILGSYIRNRGILSSYSYLTKNKSSTTSILLAGFPPNTRYFFFIVGQFGIAALSLLVGVLVSCSRTVSHCLLVSMLILLVYNGAKCMKKMIRVWRREAVLKAMELLVLHKTDELMHHFHIQTHDLSPASLKIFNQFGWRISPHNVVYPSRGETTPVSK
jgi:hypothetical protein